MGGFLAISINIPTQVFTEIEILILSTTFRIAKTVMNNKKEHLEVLLSKI